MSQRKVNQAPPIRIQPFSLENLRSVLPEPTMPVESCSICQSIGRGGARLYKSGELEYDTIPPGVQNLDYFMRLGEHVQTNWLEICPQCKRLYYCEESYEYLVNGSEDYESYSPLAPDQILELAEVSWANGTGKGELYEYPDGTWGIFHDAKNAPKA